MRPLAAIAGCLCALAFVGCSDWNLHGTVHGIAFARVKTDDRGFAIGVIAADTVAAGRACKQGWLHLHPNGTPAAFTAAQPFALGRCTIPVDTWVFQDDRGTVKVCAFPRDLQVQGHTCRGSGGPKGMQTAFYPEGALK